MYLPGQVVVYHVRRFNDVLMTVTAGKAFFTHKHPLLYEALATVTGTG